MSDDMQGTVKAIEASAKVIKAIEKLRAEGREAAEAARAERLAQQAAAERERLVDVAGRWKLLIDAMRDEIPPALHGYLTHPLDREPRTYISREVRYNCATLALPGCTPIYIYAGREGILFFRVATWVAIGDSDEGAYWAQLEPDDSVGEYELTRLYRTIGEAVEAAAIAAGEEAEVKAAAEAKAVAWLERNRERIERQEAERKTSPEAFLLSATDAPIEHAGTFALLSIAQSLIKITGQIARSE